MASTVEAVKNWLDKSGFPLEMRVAKKLVEAKFGFRQGMYIDDPTESVSREIDIHAWKVIGSYPLRINFIIECKQSSKPFLLFKYPQMTGNSFIEYLPKINQHFTNPVGLSYLRHLELYLEGGQSLEMFSSFSSSGYALKAAHIDKDNKDYAYQAVMQTVNGCLSFKANLDKLGIPYKMNSIGEMLNFAEWIIPVVVIEAPLFEVYLDLDGEIQVKQITKGLLSWFHPKVGNLSVQVLTADEVGQFLENVELSVAKIQRFAIDPKNYL